MTWFILRIGGRSPWDAGLPHVLMGRVFPLITAVVTVALASWVWSRNSRRAALGPRTAFALGLIAFLWGLSIASTFFHGELPSVYSLALPFFLFLLATKPPSQSEVFLAAQVASFALALSASIFLALEITGLLGGEPTVPRRFSVASVLGIDLPRLSGSFGNQNHAGIAGAILMAGSFLHKGARRGLVLLSGTTVFFLAESRIAFGLLVLAAVAYWWQRRRDEYRPSWFLAIALCLSSAIGAAYLVVGGGGGNGRAEIWRDYLSTFPVAGPLGVGETGIGILDLAGHGHNVIIHVTVEFGIIAGFTCLLLLFLPLFLVLTDSKRHGLKLSPTIVILVGAAMTDYAFDPRYLSVNFLALITVILLLTLSRDEPAERQIRLTTD